MSATTDLPVHTNVVAGAAAGQPGETIEVVDPSNGAAYAAVAASTPADVDHAVTAAASAFPSWSRFTPRQRYTLLNEFADAVQANFDELAALEARDAGKPLAAVAEGELLDVVDAIRSFATAGRNLPAPAAMDLFGADVTSVFRREPIGVVGAITPWNYPLVQAIAKIVPALSVGNTMVLKPSELTPLSTLRLAGIAAEVLPSGVLNVITGYGPTTGAAIVDHPGVGVVTFTGSVEGGRAVATAASRRLVKSVLELGGNAPAIVFGDADIATAARMLTASGLYNAGQECMASSRVLVHASVADDFISALVAECGTYVVGEVFEPNVNLGPLISERQLRRAENLITQRSAGSSLVLGGERLDRPGYFLPPTVVVGPDQRDPIVQTESFSPLFTVQRFNTDEEAMVMANGTAYGLAASVWTADVSRAMRTTAAIQAGTVWVNHHLAFSPDFPVNGYKDSGYGTENGLLGGLEFTRLKNITFNAEQV